jgi:hypothetical protein
MERKFPLLKGLKKFKNDLMYPAASAGRTPVKMHPAYCGTVVFAWLKIKINTII